MNHNGLTSSQLDKLGQQLRDGKLDRDVLINLTHWRNGFISSTNAVSEAIAAEIRRTRRFKADITQRPAKSTASIVSKLRRETARLTQIQDIGGLRVIVSKISVQDRAVALMAALFPGSRTIDRRDRPQHGYRAVHVVVPIGSRLIEVQVRTQLQNGWAQLSEKFSDTVDPRVKYGAGPEAVMALLQVASARVAGIEMAEQELDEYKRAEMNHLNRKKRAGKMTPVDRARLDGYLTLLARKRALKTAWKRYFVEQTT